MATEADAPAITGCLPFGWKKLVTSNYLCSLASPRVSAPESPDASLTRKDVKFSRNERRSKSVDGSGAARAATRAAASVRRSRDLESCVSVHHQSMPSTQEEANSSRVPVTFPFHTSAGQESSQTQANSKPARNTGVLEPKRSHVQDATIPVAALFLPHKQPRVKSSIRPSASPREASKPPRHVRSSSANLESLSCWVHFTSHIFMCKYEEVTSRYSMEKKLGEGAVGVVWRCIECSTGEEWACKTISKSQLTCYEDVEALLDEVAALRALADHAAIASLHDLMEDEQVGRRLTSYIF